jgi:hypothetical protein
VRLSLSSTPATPAAASTCFYLHSSKSCARAHQRKGRSVHPTMGGSPLGIVRRYKDQRSPSGGTDHRRNEMAKRFLVHIESTGSRLILRGARSAFRPIFASGLRDLFCKRGRAMIQYAVFTGRFLFSFRARDPEIRAVHPPDRHIRCFCALWLARRYLTVLGISGPTSEVATDKTCFVKDDSPLLYTTERSPCNDASRAMPPI